VSDKSKKVCPHAEACALYGLFLSEGALQVWKTLFCSGHFDRCVRYQASLEGKTSPNNLLPNGKLLEGVGI
jgi:hypothetical protein